MTENKEILYRSIASVNKIDKENRLVEFSFSSEEPYERFFGMEILGHDKENVRMKWLESGNAPLLADHNPSNQIGVIEKAYIFGKKGRVLVRFGRGKKAEEYFQDVLDGIRKNVSVGYQIYEKILEKEENEMKFYRVTDWEPKEVSLVSMPADETVGVGRSKEKGRDSEFSEKKEIEIKQEVKEMEPVNTEQSQKPAQKEIDVSAIRAEVLKTEQERTAKILNLASRHKMEKDAQAFISNGKSVEDFKDYVLENLDKNTEQPNGQKSDMQLADNPQMLGLSEKEVKQFSIGNFCKAMILKKPELAAYEFEVSEAWRETQGNRKFEGDITIPPDVIKSPLSPVTSRSSYAKRDMLAGVDPSGGYLVDTEYRGDMLVELLRSKMVLPQLGVQILSGLVGDLTIPKETGDVTCYWVSEGSAPSESTPAVGQVALRPKTLAAYTDFSRKLLLQSSPSVDMLIQRMLLASSARKIQKACFSGIGGLVEPLGIENTPDINTKDYGAGFTWADIVEMETLIAADDADAASMAYVTTPTVAGTLKTTLQNTTSANAVYLLGTDGMMNTYPVLRTNDMTAAKMILGDFSKLMIGQWAGVDIQFNPYTLDTQGLYRLRLLQEVDVAVTYPEAFCVAHT